VQDGFILVMPSKTRRHGIRVKIPVHRLLVPILQGRRDACGTNGWLFEALHHHYVTTKNGSGFSRMLELAEVEAGGAVLTFHCWRHTFRTRLAEAGVSQEVAMQLGGWTDARTAEIYNHDLSRARAAIEALV
jgi:integrase